jgi:hypothetical protein
MPSPLNPLSDPETADPNSGAGTSKGWGTLEEPMKPKGEGFADPLDEDTDPQQGTGTKTGRKENVQPKGES